VGVYECVREIHCIYLLPREEAVCCAGMLVPIYQITTWYCNPEDDKYFENKHLPYCTCYIDSFILFDKSK
jgi:hypothetical protein